MSVWESWWQVCVWVFTIHFKNFSGWLIFVIIKYRNLKLKLIWWPLWAVMVMVDLSRIERNPYNTNSTDQIVNPLNGTGETEMRVESTAEAQKVALCWCGRHGAGIPAQETRSCGQESMQHLKHKCRSFPSRQAVIISSSAASLPEGAASQTITNLKHGKFQFLDFSSNFWSLWNSAHSSRAKWNGKTSVTVNGGLKCPKLNIYELPSIVRGMHRNYCSVLMDYAGPELGSTE